MKLYFVLLIIFNIISCASLKSDELYTVVPFKRNNMPGISTINQNAFVHANTSKYPWHLSILIQMSDLINNGMPSRAENNLLYKIEDNLAVNLNKNDDSIFVSRDTYNGYRQLIFRVREPEAANIYLQSIISKKLYKREFKFKMSNDPQWEKAKWHMESIKP